MAITFSVGDRVRIVKRNLDKDNKCDGCYWADGMDNYIGNEFKIEEMINGRSARYQEWIWMFNWLDPVYSTATTTASFLIRQVIVKVPTQEDWNTVLNQALINGCIEDGTKDDDGWNYVEGNSCIRISRNGRLYSESILYYSNGFSEYQFLTTQEYLNKFKQSSDEPNKQRTIKMRVSIMMKKLLDKDARTLIKAGYIDGDLELTEKGREANDALDFERNKVELVRLANEDLEDRKNK